MKGVLIRLEFQHNQLLRVVIDYAVSEFLVPRGGLEPPRGYPHQILSLARLPVSSPRHTYIIGFYQFSSKSIITNTCKRFVEKTHFLTPYPSPLLTHLLTHQGQVRLKLY